MNSLRCSSLLAFLCLALFVGCGEAKKEKGDEVSQEFKDQMKGQYSHKETNTKGPMGKYPGMGGMYKK